MVFRRLVMSIAVVAMPLAVITTVVGSGPASAQTGHLSCSSITGSLTFSPPLKNGGTKAEVTTTNTVEKSCSGGTPDPTKVTGTSSTKSATNSCAGLIKTSTVTITLSYTPTEPKSTFSGKATPTTSPPGFKLSGKVTGSYAASTASATVKLKQTETQIKAACKSSGGLGSLTIASGSSTSS